MGKETKENLKMQFFYDYAVEVRNETDFPISVFVCKSKASKRVYIHVGPSQGQEKRIGPHDYRLVKIEEVET